MNKNQKKNYWVVGLILLGVIFGLMSAWSFYRAGREVSSVVDPEYYDRGVRYNESVSNKKTAEEMGWHAIVDVKEHRVTVRLLTADTSPVSGCKARISLRQTQDKTIPSHFELNEEAPGTYTAELPAALTGAVPAELSLGKDNLLLEQQVLINIPRG